MMFKRTEEDKVVPSAGKIMALVFCEARVVILVDVTENHHRSFLYWITGEIEHCNTEKAALFHQNNAPA